MTKKLMSILTALALLFCQLPLTALAADPPVQSGGRPFVVHYWVPFETPRMLGGDITVNQDGSTTISGSAVYSDGTKVDTLEHVIDVAGGTKGRMPYNDDTAYASSHVLLQPATDASGNQITDMYVLRNLSPDELHAIKEVDYLNEYNIFRGYVQVYLPQPQIFPLTTNMQYLGQLSTSKPGVEAYTIEKIVVAAPDRSFLQVFVDDESKLTATERNANWTVMSTAELENLGMSATGDPDSLIIMDRDDLNIHIFYKANTVTTKIPADFYDYNITQNIDGVYYTDMRGINASDANNPLYDGVTSRWKRNPDVIPDHPDINANEKTAYFAFGNNNASTGLGTETWLDETLWAVTRPDYPYKSDLVGEVDESMFAPDKYDTPNMYNSNNRNFGGVTFDLTRRAIMNDEMENGVVTGRKLPRVAENIYHKDLFSYGNEWGKQVFKGWNLVFTQTGDTYVIQSVENSKGQTVSSDLNMFHRTTHYLGSDDPDDWRVLYANDFWPMDGLYADADDNPQHGIRQGYTPDPVTNPNPDPEFGGNTTIAVNGTTSNLPVSDNGIDHNSYFGMRYTLRFTVDEDFCGPLSYLFYGDDDMWVYLEYPDGRTKQVIDIGGVHSSVGMKSDLWKYIDHTVVKEDGSPLGENETMANTITFNKVKQPGIYKLHIFYTERGASGSSCYMEFNLPSVMREYQGNVKDLVIGKEVVTNAQGYTPSLVPADQEFEFSIEVTHPAFEASEGYVIPYLIYNADESLVTEYPDAPKLTYGGGPTTVKLKHGQFVVFKDLAIGAQYKIQEINSSDFSTRVNAFKLSLKPGSEGDSSFPSDKLYNQHNVATTTGPVVTGEILDNDFVEGQTINAYAYLFENTSIYAVTTCDLVFDKLLDNKVASAEQQQAGAATNFEFNAYYVPKLPEELGLDGDAFDASAFLANTAYATPYAMGPVYSDQQGKVLVLGQKKLGTNYGIPQNLQFTANEAGQTFHYLIVEKAAAGSPYVYDPAVYGASVSVSLKDGKVVCTPSYFKLEKGKVVSNNAPAFLNQSKTDLILYKKGADSAAYLTGAEFTLSHTCASCGLTLPDVTSVAVSGAQPYALVSGLVVGHEYLLTETKAPGDNYLLPASGWKLKVSADGYKTYSLTIDNRADVSVLTSQWAWSGTDAVPTFAVEITDGVRYQPATLRIGATKMLDGRVPQDQYSFELRSVPSVLGDPVQSDTFDRAAYGDSATLLTTVTNLGSDITFPQFTYTIANIGDQYTFLVREIPGTDVRIIYDETVYLVKVEIQATPAHPTNPGVITPTITAIYEIEEDGELIPYTEGNVLAFENFHVPPVTGDATPLYLYASVMLMAMASMAALLRRRSHR